jgi:Fe-S cluster assembly protein SufB
VSTDPRALVEREYKAGFVTDIESDSVPAGLSEDVIRLISILCLFRISDSMSSVN